MYKPCHLMIMRPTGITAILLCLLMIMGGAVAMAAEDAPEPDQSAEPAGLTIKINQQLVNFEILPILRDGRVFVPLRPLFEALRARVDYYDGEIYGARGAQAMSLTLGEPLAKIAGNMVEMDTLPFVVAGRTYVPVRFITQALGDEVSWDGETQTVVIHSPYLRNFGPAAGLTTGRAPRIAYTQEEFDWLVRVINAEAYDEPLEGMIAVGAVIINRVLNDDGWLPDSIIEVLFQAGQFTVIANGQVNRSVRPESYDAAMRALYGEDPTGGAIYFFNPSISSDAFMHGRETIIEIGRHRFAR